MTHDRMTKETQMTNDEDPPHFRWSIDHSCFVIHSTFDIRHSSF
jgi:hypothetical protein